MTATETNGLKLAPTEPVKRGFRVPCPKCTSDGVRLDAGDLYQAYCPNCDEEIDVNDMRALVEGWRALLSWTDTAPALD